MRKTIQTGCLLLVVCTGLEISQPAQATVIYREVFGRNDNKTLEYYDLVDWNANYVSSTGATMQGTTNTNTKLAFQLHTANGWTTDLPNVNAGTAISESFGYAGRLNTISNPNGHRSAVWTEEYVVDRSVWAIDTISFYSNNSDAVDENVRILVAVDSLNTPGNLTDDVWLVSSETFNSSGGSPTNWSTNKVQHVLNFSTLSTAWQSLTFNPLYGSGTSAGTNLGSPGIATAFPDGNITAFGLYMPPSNSIIRFDTYQIDAHAVPEPASASLLILGLVGLGRFRRRKV